MIDRTHLRNFLNSIPGLEGWSDSVEHLNGVEMVLDALAEPTPEMIEAAGKCDRWTFDEAKDRRNIYRAMWSARFRGE